MGGVIFPIPRFTPMMAAKWMGSIPISFISGSSSGVHRSIPDTSSISIPMMTRKILHIRRMTYLLSETLKSAFFKISGTPAMVKFLATIMMTNSMTMMTPVVVPVSMKMLFKSLHFMPL